MRSDAAHDFIRALAHRERCEADAVIESHGGTTEIRYAMPLTWPWPRQFSYTREFFCTGGGAASLHDIAAAGMQTQEHVVNLFADNLAREAQPFIDAGYVQAWTSVLLGRALHTAWQRPPAPDACLHEVASAADMARYAALAGISNRGEARNACIHNVYATRGDEVVAKGQLVLLSGRQAYISDMSTAPAHRRTGLCSTLLQALEDKARSLGATQACLAPGQEVASFGLYERYGYVAVAARAVLIPREAAP